MRTLTPSKYSGSSGFTIVEIMIVVAIIALLAILAVPAFIKSRIDARAVTISKEIIVLHDAFKVYTLANGDLPPQPATMGQLPAGIEEYINSNIWYDGVEVSGDYMYLFYNVVGAYVIYIDEGPGATLMQRVDFYLDDDNLASGAFRQGNGNNFFFIITQ